MRPGDPVVFWVTGAARANIAPGVWGVGYVKAPVNVEATADNPFSDDDANDGYWLDSDMRARARFFVEVDVPLLDEPVTRDRIQATPALAATEILRQPQMGNPSWLTSNEWAALQQLLGESALVPVDPADVAEWNRVADTQEPDLLFRGETGTELSESVYGRAWEHARIAALAPAEAASPLAKRPYDLRHACLSTWLNAGVDPTQVAEWAGNSVNVLLRVYAKCIAGRYRIARQRIERALRNDT